MTNLYRMAWQIRYQSELIWDQSLFIIVKPRISVIMEHAFIENLDKFAKM